MAANNVLNPRLALANVPVNLQGPPQIQSGTVPDDSQVTAQVLFTQKVKRLKLEQGQPGVPPISDADFASAVKGEHMIVDAATVQHANMHGELQSLRAQMHNMKRVLYNSKQICSDHIFQPLEVEESGGTQAIGDIPDFIKNQGPFPETVNELEHLSLIQVTALQEYYNTSFGIQAGDRLATRVAKFRNFIGR